MKRNILTVVLGALFYPLSAVEAGTAGAASEKVKFCDKNWDESGVVSFTFGNGTKLEFVVNKGDPETRLHLPCHGASQKIGDSFAGAKGNYAEGISSAQAVIDQLYAGEWNAA